MERFFLLITLLVLIWRHNEAASTTKLTSDFATSSKTPSLTPEIPSSSPETPYSTPKMMSTEVPSAPPIDESIVTDPPTTSSAFSSTTGPPEMDKVISEIKTTVTPQSTGSDSKTPMPVSTVFMTDPTTESSVRTVAPSSTESAARIDSTSSVGTSSAPNIQDNDNEEEDEPEIIPSFIDFMDNNIKFSLNMHKMLAKNKKNPEENIFFSPLSLFSALLMLHYGAKGNTAAEMEDAMDINTISSDMDIVHKMYGSILETVVEDKMAQSYILMANKIFINMNYDIQNSYEDGIKSYYNASVEKVDFFEAHTTPLINAWVAHTTKGHITDLFKTTLPGSTSAVLLNALYFSGDWQYQFQPTSTVDNESFFVTPSKPVNVSMMINKVKLAYGENAELGASILELPYIGDRLSMFLVLPNETNTIEDVENNISIDSLKVLLRSMRRHIMNIRIPKFSLRDSPSVVDSLRDLGMKDLFSSDADLSGLAPGLQISAIKHEATIDVSETGSIASAATGVILERLGSSFERHFEVDRPSLFFIIDKQNGLILFMGRLSNPSS